MHPDPAMMSPIERSLCRLGVHDHLCLIYERNEDRLRAMIPFVRQGLENGDRCVYVADGDTVDAVSGAMRVGGVKVDDALRTGALTVARYRDIYLAPGAFDPDKVLDFAAGAGIQAVGEGYRGLRIAGEMSWVLHGDPGADRILEYETKVNTRIHQTPVTAICQYDRAQFTPEVIRDVIRTHPLVVIGDRVCRNFYYVPPGELRGPNMLDREVDRLLENILERERAEDALRDSERRLSLVLEGSSDAFWDWELPSGRLIHSARWAAMLGRPPVEQRGDLDGWRRVTHPEDWPALERALRDHLAGRTDQFSFEHRVRAADGQWRSVHARGKVVARDADGAPRRVSGTVTEVTERRSLQARLETATRLASVGTLAAGVAHEINNPLTFVTNNLRFVADEVEEATRAPAAFALKIVEIRQALAEALDGAARVRDIVQALRTLAGPSRERRPIPVDVRAEIEAAVGISRGQVSARARFVVDVPEGLPRVIAGPHELGQVVLNLLVNAAQAVPEGRAERNEVAVVARRVEDQVAIDVIDTGTGIPAELLPRIFDPFFTTKEIGVGTGLGLAICHRIIESAGGTIEVRSEPGQGTRFRILLPAAPPEAVEVPEAPAERRSPRRVLLIDDEPFVGRAMARILERDHRVEVLSSAEEAVRKIAAGERWDAVVCDLLMPGMTGMDFADEVERMAPDVGSRLIFMSGGACTERARAFLDRGAYVCLEKPVEPSDLREAVDRLATKNVPSTPAGAPTPPA